MLRYVTVHVKFKPDFCDTEEHGPLYKITVQLYGASRYPSNEANLMRPLKPTEQARRSTRGYDAPVNCVYSGNAESSSTALFKSFLQLNAAIPSLDSDEFVSLPFPMQFLFMVLKQ